MFRTISEAISLIIFVLTIQLLCVSCKDCKLKSKCSCSFDDGSGTVDISSLGNTDNTPRFLDILQPDENYYYSYNPCGGFSEGKSCSNAAVCLSNQDKSMQQQIGDASAVAFRYDKPSGHVIVAYTSGSGVQRVTSVNLICDENAKEPTLVPQGEQDVGQFELTLTTICACPGMCPYPRANSISAGSIILITFISLLVLYVMCGVIFMKFRKNATGTELFPNKDFWLRTTGNVVVGCKFVVSKITRKEYEPLP